MLDNSSSSPSTSFSCSFTSAANRLITNSASAAVSRPSPLTSLVQGNNLPLGGSIQGIDHVQRITPRDDAVAVDIGRSRRRRQQRFAFRGSCRRRRHPGRVSGESEQLVEVAGKAGEVQHRDRAGMVQVDILRCESLIGRHVRVGIDGLAKPVTEAGKVQDRDRTAAVPVALQHEQAVVLAADQRESGTAGQRRFEFQLINTVGQLIGIQVDRQLVSLQDELIVARVSIT